MPNQPYDADDSTAVALSQIQESYLEENYYQCLVSACELLMRLKDDRGSRLNNAALHFIYVSALHLKNDADAGDEGKDKVACSFCGKSSPEVRLGAGPSAFICNECVGAFSSILN